MGDVVAVTGPLFPALAAAAVFTIMFALGLAMDRRELPTAMGDRGLLIRGLFSVLVAVPVVAVVVLRLSGLPREAELGVVLMAIAPGAPIALRRSIDAAGSRSFSPVLQMLIATLAVVSMPASIAILNVVYAAHASIAPVAVAGQVLRAQLLPLWLGLLIRHLAPAAADRLERAFSRLGAALLVVVGVFALVTIAPAAVAAGPRLGLAIAIVTALALLVGHALGGPHPDTRTAVAIVSAARNPGLALLVAILNGAAPAVIRAVLEHIIVSAVVVGLYAAWRRRRRRRRP
jgi:BASS family bile acid:Na+ symporter